MDFLKIWFLYLGLLLTISVGRNDAFRNKRMIGGDVTVHNKFPYLVFIYHKHNDSKGVTSNACGGSILDDYHIISAAHCFINTDKSPYLWQEGSYFVAAGVTDLKKDDPTKWVIASVERIYVPKKFNVSLMMNDKTTVADIAVIKLKNSLNLEKNRHLSAVSLPDDGDHSYVNETITISGYGYNQYEFYPLNKTSREGEWKGSSDGKLRYANITVLSKTECQNKWDTAFPRGWRSQNITEKHICTQVYQRNRLKPEGICQMDSGGPIVLDRNILIGVINTMGFRCREHQLPARHTRVSAFIDFIEEAKYNYITNNYPGSNILIRKPPFKQLSYFFQ